MSIRAPDPHNLRNLATTATSPAAVIDVDRPCRACGYNLRGLRFGIDCPECGEPSSIPDDIDQPLSLMPVRVIVAFIRGCWVASLCLIIIMGVVIAGQFPHVSQKWVQTALVGASVLWVGAVWWLTPAFPIRQAVIRGFSKHSRLRQATRWLQWGWVLMAGLRLVEILLPNAPASGAALLRFGQAVGMAAGLCGIVMLSVLMERLAEWTRDDTAERMFNWAAWGLPIITILRLIDISHPLISLAMLLLWLLAVGVFPWGLISLSSTVTLSIVHAKEHEMRMQRRQERQQEYQESVADSIKRMDRLRAARGKGA